MHPTQEPIVLPYQSQFDGCRTRQELEDALALDNLLDHIVNRMPLYPPNQELPMK